MRAKIFSLFAVLSFAFAMLAMSQPASAARSCAGSVAAKSAGKGFLAAARSGSPAAFSRALGRYVNMRRISFFALGRYRRKLPRSQYGRFVRLSRQYIARKLARYASSFRGGSLEVTRCGRNLVETRLKPGGQRVVWRMAGRGIADVKISNVWLGVALRDHYASLIRRAGGDMRRFMAALR